MEKFILTVSKIGNESHTINNENCDVKLSSCTEWKEEWIVTEKGTGKVVDQKIVERFTTTNQSGLEDMWDVCPHCGAIFHNSSLDGEYDCSQH